MPPGAVAPPRLARPAERLAGFDAVRGLGAVAVVVLHAAYGYSHIRMPGLIWPVPLDEPSRAAHAAFWWIEGCIMPLFLTVSGYFLARSLERQTPGDVLRGRTARLLRPMLTLGLLVLVLDTQIWTAGLVATDRATWREFLRLKFIPPIQNHFWGPGHLWYVEYLWLICAAVCVGAWLKNRLFSEQQKEFRDDGSAQRLPGCWRRGCSRC